MEFITILKARTSWIRRRSCISAGFGDFSGLFVDLSEICEVICKVSLKEVSLVGGGFLGR